MRVSHVVPKLSQLAATYGNINPPPAPTGHKLKQSCHNVILGIMQRKSTLMPSSRSLVKTGWFHVNDETCRLCHCQMTLWPALLPSAVVNPSFSGQCVCLVVLCASTWLFGKGGSAQRLKNTFIIHFSHFWVKDDAQSPRCSGKRRERLLCWLPPKHKMAS